MNRKEIIKNNKMKYKQCEIPYCINYGKRKNLYICIKDCKITVKVPYNMSEIEIEKYLLKKINWINKHLEKQKNNKRIEVKYQTGDNFTILGKKYILKVELVNKGYNSVKIKEKLIIVSINITKLVLNNNILFNDIEYYEIIKLAVEKQIEKLYRNIANNEVKAAMDEVTQMVGITPYEYKIKKMKSVWGNCSSKRKISINYEVVKYDRIFIKYVVLHEICHLKYMNHSKNFWNMVEYYMPDYKLVKKICYKNS